MNDLQGRVWQSALSVVCGMFIGVLLYQSSRIDAGVRSLEKPTAYANNNSNTGDPCDPSGDPYEYCVCQTGSPEHCGGGGISSWPAGCSAGQITCGGGCCDFDTQYCDLYSETCVNRTLSSTTPPPPPPSSDPPSSDPPSSGGSSSPC